MGKQWFVSIALGILLGCGGQEQKQAASIGVVEDLGGLTVTVPDGWVSEPPANSMRKAQYRLPGENGDAELVVTYFGLQGAGGVEANIARWRGQFNGSDGGSVKTRSVSGMNVTVLDQRMLAAIVENAKGAFYFKLVGPKATVTRWEASFDQFIDSIESSGGAA